MPSATQTATRHIAELDGRRASCTFRLADKQFAQLTVCHLNGERFALPSFTNRPSLIAGRPFPTPFLTMELRLKKTIARATTTSKLAKATIPFGETPFFHK